MKMSSLAESTLGGLPPSPPGIRWMAGVLALLSSVLIGLHPYAGAAGAMSHPRRTPSRYSAARPRPLPLHGWCRRSGA